MPKINVFSRDNRLTSPGILDYITSLVTQSVTPISNPTFNSVDITTDLTVGDDLVVNGNLTVNGQISVISSDITEFKDNILTINSQETGSGITANISGIEIERGSLTNYQFIFQESSQTFRIGQVGNLQAVATRQDSPLSNGVMIYNNSANRLDAVNNIPIDITFSSNSNSNNSNTGAIRVTGGIGVTQDITIDGRIYFRGSGGYANYLQSNSSNNFIINSNNNIIFLMQANRTIQIPTNVSVFFGVSTQNITGNGTDLTLNSGADINLTATTNINIPQDVYLTFGNTNNKIKYNGTDILLNASNKFIINSITEITNTTTSGSSLSGALLLSGGIGNSNTTDASSSSNGGTLTLAGGAGIAKKVYIGGVLTIEDSSVSSTISMGSINTAGGVGITKNLNVGYGLNVSSSLTGTPDLSGKYISLSASTFTDTNTTNAGTAPYISFNSIAQPILSAQNTNVTTTEATTVYIGGGPTPGTNQTITNSYGLWNVGNTKLEGSLLITNSTSSNNNVSGAVVVMGGVAINKELNVGYNLNISSSLSGSPSLIGKYLSISSSNFTDNTTAASGTADNMVFNSIAQPVLSATNSTITTTNAATLAIEGAPAIGSNQTITNSYALWVRSGISKFDGSFSISDNTPSTSYTTGALILNGGIGISQTTDAVSITNGGSITTAGGVAIAKKLFVGGMTTILNTIESSSLSTGSINTLGGVGITKNLNVGYNFNVSSNTTGTPDLIGKYIALTSSTFTDDLTGNSGTVSNMSFNSIAQPTLSAQNTNITTINAATLYIGGGPIAGTNQTITNSYGLWNVGKTKLDGIVSITNNTNSSNTTTGALVVTGGIATGGNLNVNGQLMVNSSSSLNQTSIDTTAGGFSITGPNNVNISVNNTSTIETLLGSLTLNGNNSLALNSNSGSIVLTGNAASSFSATTGLLTISGIGVTIQGNTGETTISNTGKLVLSSGTNGVAIDTTDTTNGIKIGVNSPNTPITIGNAISNTIISGNLSINGDLLVSGTNTIINTETLLIEDNILLINSAPSGTTDGGLLIKRFQLPNNINSGDLITNDSAAITSTFQAGSSTPSSVVLNSSSSGITDFYKGWWIQITSGAGINQIRRIKSYNGTTKTATIYITSENTVSPPFYDGLNLVTAPSNGDTYNLYNNYYSSLFYQETSKNFILASTAIEPGATSINIQNYLPLHVKSLTTETTNTFNGSLILNNTQAINITNTNALKISKTNGTDEVFNVDTTNSILNLTNPVNTVNSTSILNFSAYDNLNSSNIYNQIKSVVKGSNSGSLTSNLEFNVVSASSLINFITLKSDTNTCEFNNSVISSSITTASTSNTTGSLLLSGGIGINKTTDAVSSTNGGTITTAGGVAIAKSLYVGGSIASFAQGLNISSSLSGTPATTGPYLRIGSSTFTDNNTASAGTAASMVYNSIAAPTLAATNTTVTTTNAATLYIAGGPTAGTNQTLTNSYGLWNVGNTRHDGIITGTNTTATTSSTTGSLLLSGGLAISNTTDASSSTNGGTITTAGGVAIAKSLYVGGTTTSTSSTTGAVILSGGLAISNTTDATSSTNGGTITTAGGAAIAKNLYVGGTTTTTSTTTGALVITGGLAISTTTEATSSSNGGCLTIAGGAALPKRIFTGSTRSGAGNIIGCNIVQNSHTYTDNTVAQDSTIAIWAFNALRTPTLAATNTNITYNNVANLYIEANPVFGTNINTTNSYGLWNGGATRLDGQLRVLATTASTNNSTGAFLLSGGLAISNTTDASSFTVGGTITSAGGAAFAKRVYVGDLATVRTLFVNSSGSQTGTPSATGAFMSVAANTFTDSATAASGTAATATFISFATPTLSATNTGITTTNAATVYIAGGPIAGTNETLTNSYGLWNVGNTRHDGIITSTNTTASTSATTGSLLLSGSIGISKTTDASSSTNGGTITTAGGLAVGKAAYIGTKLYFDYNQPYSITGNSLGHLLFQAHSSSINSTIKYFSSDGNNTTDNFVDIYGFGTSSSLTNTEYLRCGFDQTSTSYNIKMVVSGTGNIRPISLYVGSNTDQLTLNTDGSILLSNTTASTSSSLGALKVSGGISISKTTDAISSTNGGTITTAGGLAVAKNIYSGGLTIETALTNRAISISNSSNLRWAFQIITTESGSNTGSNLNLNAYDDSNTLLSTPININRSLGDITFTSTTPTTSNTTGALKLSGGIGITLTTNATSYTNGGTITTAGGATISKDLYVGQNLYVNGTLNLVGGISAGVTTPTITISNLVNTGSITVYTNKCIANGDENTLSAVFTGTPTSANSLCSFEISLADFPTFANNYDVVPNVSGFYDNTNYYSIENILAFAVPSTNRIRIKFTSSSSTDIHTLQLILRYTTV